LSAITPIPAIRRTAQNKRAGDVALGRAAVEKNKMPDTAIVALTTAIPPPCGVGILCDERVLGFARA
jgi:hypothetical protein